MKKTISIVLILVLSMFMEVANADFTFGEPTNLGPTVNSAYRENQPFISIDRLSLYFGSNRPGTSGERDIWVTTRATIDDDWSTPVNLGPPVNSPFFESNPYISPNGLEFYFASKSRPGGFGYDDIWVSRRVSSREGKDVVWGDPVSLGSSINTWAADFGPKLSADGLELYFNSTGHGGFGGHDIFVVKRATVTDDWGAPVNLGPVVNGPSHDIHPTISTDGLCLIFSEHGSAGPYRPGGFGGPDIWMTTRPTPEGNWGSPVNLGPTVNGSSVDNTPYISHDGSILYFSSSRPGGFGDRDLWQVPIEPVVDLNGDGIVGGADLSIIADHWGTDDSLCDIGPMPWGDGVVDVKDLIVIAEYLEKVTPIEEVNVNEDDDGGQTELEQGQILVVTLDSNPTTGYSWQQAENQEPILEQMGQPEFKQSLTDGPPMVGAGGWEIFRFKAISTGQMTLQLVYRRSWEEGVEPVNTFSLDVVIY